MYESLKREAAEAFQAKFAADILEKIALMK